MGSYMNAPKLIGLPKGLFTTTACSSSDDNYIVLAPPNSLRLRHSRIEGYDVGGTIQCDSRGVICVQAIGHPLYPRH